MVTFFKCHKSFLMAFLLFNTVLAKADIKNILNNDKVRDGISKQLANMNISFGVDFFKIRQTGLSADIGWKYAVEPSYQDGFFSRFDKYPGRISVNPIQLIYKESNLGVSLAANAELQFVRQYRDQKKALASLPYSPTKAPITSKKAIKELAVGDYASIIYRLSAFAGYGDNWSDFVKSSMKVGHSLSSQYGAQVFRLRENHIRLRLFAERSNGPGFALKSKLDDDEFDLFSTDYINDAILKLIKSDFIEATKYSRQRELFLADFVINLNNEESKAAYDRVMKKIVDIRDRKYRVLNPLRSEDDIIKFLLEYTKELE
ncbi:MAG: hypothetical protein KDD40_11350, partial [Bdellovibrionales bacterium]|nr:hypothetical protein [Bdellovibrionales bacterium]